MKNTDTKLVHAGYERTGVRSVNPPLQRASTFLFDTVDALEAGKNARFEPDNVFYARLGTPNAYEFEHAMSELEGGKYSLSVPSGLAANVLPAVAFAKAGTRILVTDSVYDPARGSFSKFFAPMGVEVVFYDPRIGAGISDLMTDNTSLVFVESPGSLTFELQDIPAIAKAAHEKGALVVCDNTYGTGYFHRALDLGADIVAQAATKYVIGHSDAMLGVLTCKTIEVYRALKEAANWVGHGVAPDIVWTAMRGLRTLPVRMQRHFENGVALARWCEERPEIARVIHPGLESHPDHEIWKRDFTGATGLFSIILDTTDQARAKDFVEALQLFGMGFSWGGYESLVLISNPKKVRSTVKWDEDRILVRIHAGLEDIDDLIADLDQALGKAFG